MKELTGLINGIKNIIGMFKIIFDMIEQFFSMLGMLFTYITRVIQLLGDIALSTPIWLRTFVLLTTAISVIYLILGRNTGKSD